MNTEVARIIRDRRTIHNFQPDRLPPREHIIAAISHAMWAPNHHITEPWRFYLIGEQTKERICVLNAEILQQARGAEAARIKLQRWREIPGWMLLTCSESKNRIRAMEDYAACCCAAQNFMLYLWSLDIGVKWSTGGLIRNPDFYQIVGMDPQQETPIGLFWYGYAQDIPQTTRKPHEEKLVELP
jgi:nitroreductase